ncbi:MAG: type IV secretory system conjugative DNA transfer family protein [Sphingomonadaceae bacterium]
MDKKTLFKWAGIAVAVMIALKLAMARQHNGLLPDLTMMRVLMMAFSIGAGFALGWVLSPAGAMFRRVAMVIVVGLMLTIAILHDGSMGWSMASTISIFGFFFAMSYALGGIAKDGLVGFMDPPTTFGSARWADIDHCRANDLIGEGGIRLGAFIAPDVNEPLHYDGDRHLMTVAPTRSGKGTTAIVPNLLTYGGGVLVIDPKGENAMITREARAKMGQDVFVVDPWMIASGSAERPARFNPLDWLVQGDIDITENAMLLADALVVPDNSGDRFWTEEAKALLQGVILYVATEEAEAQSRHLGRVRDLLLLDGQDMPELFRRMTSSAHHIVASTGARCLQKDEKLLSNVIASAQAQTHFLDSARIRESLSASDFKFEDLKTKPMSIYLVLPSDRLNAFNRWLRLLIQRAITVNARNIEIKPDKPVLFLLDEMPALGRLTMVEEAFGLMAGFGIQLWGIVQDLSQLKAIYGDGYEGMIANSGMIQYFGSRDRITAEYFSALCGETTVWNLTSALARAFGSSSGGGGVTNSSSTTSTDTTAAVQRKLAYPDELMRMHGSKQLIFIENHHPIIGTKRRWFDDPALQSVGRNLHDS